MIKAEPTAESNSTWSCDDPHQAAFLECRGVGIVCELTEDGDRVRFVYERSERVAKLVREFNENAPVSVRSYIHTLRALRARMYELKDQARLSVAIPCSRVDRKQAAAESST